MYSVCVDGWWHFDLPLPIAFALFRHCQRVPATWRGWCVRIARADGSTVREWRQ